VRDGIQLALRNIPTVALVTEPFWQQGDLIALSGGMPDIPRVRLPHPVAGSSAAEMAALADQIAPRLVDVLSGRQPGDNEPVAPESAA
jgi:hypothetical protein